MSEDAQQQSRSQTAGAVLRRTAPPALAGSQPPLRGWPPAPPRSARPPQPSNVDNTDTKPAAPAAASRPAGGRPLNVDKKGIRPPRPAKPSNVDAAAVPPEAPAASPEVPDFVETMPEMPAAPRQPVPTRLADPSKGRAGGPSGPDPERVRNLREARKKVLADRAKARGADPGAGSVASVRGGTRSAMTQEQYLRRGRMLLNRYRRENGLGSAMDDVNPVEFVNWLLSLKTELKSSTWRYYRQAGSATISGLPHHQTEAALAMLDADVIETPKESKTSQTKSQGPRRTSGLKEKRFPKNDFDTVYANLKYISRSSLSPVLMDWMQSGVVTGLRPIEWRATEMEIQNDPTAMRGRRAWLYVLNAKATNGRSNGAVRTLDLSNVSDDALQAVARMSDRGSQWLIDGNYDIMQSGCSQLLYTICDRVFSSRIYSLYSLRHQFIANMKSIARPEEVSALAGHGVTNTAAENYGRRRSAWPPEDIVEVAAPVPEEVSTVRQRMRFFEERIRIQRAAGLLKDQPSAGEGDGEPEAVA